MYNDNQNNPQDFRQTGRGNHGARGMRGGMNATDDMPQDGQSMDMARSGQGMGMAQCRRHGGNGGRGRNGMGMGQNGQGMGQCQRRNGNGMPQGRSMLPDSAPTTPAGDGKDD